MCLSEQVSKFVVFVPLIQNSMCWYLHSAAEHQTTTMWEQLDYQGPEVFSEMASPPPFYFQYPQQLLPAYSLLRLITLSTLTRVVQLGTRHAKQNL